ncbi:MAG: ion channel [Gaiellales bacterium]|jgi:hypothetical protein
MAAIGEELTRLTTVGERHRRLAARLLLVVGATLVLDLIAGVVMFFAERHSPRTQIYTIGQALFFVTTQLLTVSSSMANPLTVAGRLVNVALELWAVPVVAGSAGAIASFQSSDAPWPRMGEEP